MTRPIGSGTAGSQSAPTAFPERWAFTAIPAGTTATPAAAVEYLRLDDGFGNDFVLPAGVHRFTGSLFFAVDQNNTAFYSLLEFNIGGSGWTALGNPVIVELNSGRALPITAIGPLPPFLVNVPIKLRFVHARSSGTGTVTCEQAYMEIIRIG